MSESSATCYFRCNRPPTEPKPCEHARRRPRSQFSLWQTSCRWDAAFLSSWPGQKHTIFCYMQTYNEILNQQVDLR